MKSLSALLVVATLLLLAPLQALCRDVKIIASPSVRAESITVAELKSVFLEEKRSLSDGSHIEPVLAKSGAAHEVFLKHYLGKSDDELQTYYHTMVFTGTGAMPKFLGSDIDIVHYVARTKGAIGYVDSDVPVEGVKVLTVVQGGTNTGRRLLTRVEPAYPETLQRLQIGGTVRLVITISPKGNVDKVEVLGGNPILGEAAAKAVKQWVYSPSASPTTMEISVPFAARP